MPQLSSASAVYNPGWLGFLRHVDNQEGWYDYADAHVNVKESSENFIEPISKCKAEEYPFRTTCYKIDTVCHVSETNLKIHPPDCDGHFCLQTIPSLRSTKQGSLNGARSVLICNNITPPYIPMSSRLLRRITLVNRGLLPACDAK